MLAIVLGRRDFKEADQIISLYTAASGKREALAKGVKKIISKQSGHLEPFTLIEVEIIKGKELDHLAKVAVINIFKDIRNNLEKSLLASYAVKLVNKMTVIGEEDKRAFSLVQDWLEYIDGAVKAEKNLLYSFIVKLFNCLGFAPELEECVSCGLPQKDFVGFDVQNGGVCCGDCKKSSVGKNHIFSLTAGEINFFRVLLNGQWAEIESCGKNEKVLEMINKFGQFHCGQKILVYN